MESLGSGVDFNWLGRQLQAIQVENTDFITYTYNADGQRTSKTVGGVTTNYYYNGSILAGEKTGENTTTFMYDNNGDYFGFTYNGVDYYYIKNAQNDVVAIADNTGTAIAAYSYDAWGALLGSWGDNTVLSVNPILYRSYYCDLEIGFYYLNSRYYVPNMCRFLNADGQLNQGMSLLGYNMFAYCNNNPVGLSDVNGDKPGDCFSSVDAAAKDAALYMGGKSFSERCEYATSIYEIKLTLYTTKYVKKRSFGKTRTVKKYVKKELTYYTYTKPKKGNIGRVTAPRVPTGKTRVAYVHTHVYINGPNIDRNFIFSDPDKSYADYLSANAYLYSPDGTVRRYNHNTSEDIQVFHDLPKDPNMK